MCCTYGSPYQEDVNDQVSWYCQFGLDEAMTNNDVPTINSCKQFDSLEQFLNNRAAIVFKKCKIYGFQKRFNILNYNT